MTAAQEPLRQPSPTPYKCETYRAFAARIEERLSSSNCSIVGIDGCGAAGKSTLAKHIAARLGGIIIAMDDFYLPKKDRTRRDPFGALFDWQRLRDSVLIPLRNESPATYARYNWDEDRFGDSVCLPATGVFIVEGVYSTRTEINSMYDLRIWIDCPPELRLIRGLERDGEQARLSWERDWMPQEAKYVAIDRPQERAHVWVDGRGCPCKGEVRALWRN